MKNNAKVLIVIGILIIGLGVSLFLSNRATQVPDNPVSTTGNTAGNLNNGGLFCEDEGIVYFSNTYDNGCLYSMNADETGLKKITTSTVSSINAAGNHLYYFMDSSSGGTGLGYIIRTFGIYRSEKNGENTTCLLKDGCITMQLVGNHLYYQRYNNKDFTNVYKIKTDKSENVPVADFLFNPVAAHNGIIYYNGQEKDHYLYALDTATDESSVVYEGNLWYPAYHEGYIYFMDVSENYRLCRYHLTDNYVEVLTNDRVDTFNVGTSYIYYQKNDADTPGIWRMRLDGSSAEQVAEGIYRNIHLTSRYAYFQAYGDDMTIYHTPVEGSVNVSEFTPALAAAIEKAGK